MAVPLPGVRRASPTLRAALQKRLGPLGPPAGLTWPWELCFIDFDRERIELTLRLPVEADLMARIKALIDEDVRSARAATVRREQQLREQTVKAQSDDTELDAGAVEAVAVLRGSQSHR